MSTEPKPRLDPGRRILMGPGPSDVDPRVTAALATPVTGHLDPWFLATMERTAAMLREVFGTANATTLALPGTGTSGMEACLANLLEPGDLCLVGVNGYFGNRLADIAERLSARVLRVEAPWGEAIPEEAFAAAVRRERPKVAALVHAETSTGVLQPVSRIGAATREAGCLLVLDCVTSLGGLPVRVDEWGVDAAYSGSQKCLSAPPGLSPVTFSDRAMEVVRARRRPVSTFYLDIGLLDAYWRRRPAPYHHTASTPLVCALHEALRLALEEGLEARFARHRRVHEALLAGLPEIGLEPFVPADRRLPMLNPLRVPDGVDEGAVRRRLLAGHGLEIGAGLGPLAGRIWRVGLMGASATEAHVRTFLETMGDALRREGRGA